MIDTKALRNKILDLAISGKLTKQLPEDGNAEDLYAQIQEEKAKLIAKGKIKKEKPLPPISEEEIPFEIPENWICCRLGSIITLQSGADLKPSDYNSESIGIPYMTGASNFGEDGSMLINRWTDKPKNIARENDILLSCKGTVGKLAVLKIDEVHIARQIMAIRTYCKSRNYLFYYLLSVVETLKNAQKGLIPGIERSDILERVCSLPPLAEQKRIVSVVEDAFAVIDRIEKEQESYFADQEVLKNKIIDAGIRGKLTEQHPEDGDAEVLYAQIQAEKAKLIAEGRIKKEKSLPPITEEEIPFEIPENWKWVRLGNISNYGNKTRKVQPVDMDSDTWLLELEDIASGGELICKTKVKERQPKGEKVLFHKGEILYSKLRPYLKKVIIADEDGIATPELVPFTVYGGSKNGFISQCLISSYSDKLVNQRSFGVKMPRVDTDFMRQLPIPLPPIAEQERIVNKINTMIGTINSCF